MSIFFDYLIGISVIISIAIFSVLSLKYSLKYFHADYGLSLKDMIITVVLVYSLVPVLFIGIIVGWDIIIARHRLQKLSDSIIIEMIVLIFPIIATAVLFSWTTLL